MKKNWIVGVVLAAAVAGGACWWFWGRAPAEAEPETFIFARENPDEGGLKLDMLLNLQLGRDLHHDPQLPPVPEDRVAAEPNDYFLVGCDAPSNTDIGREQARWPEILRPKRLYVDKATRKLIGGYSRSARRTSRKEQMQELIALAVFLEKGGFTVVNMRHKDNRMAYDLVDPYQRRRVLTVTTYGDGNLHWADLNYFDADSCLARGELNRIPQPEEIPPEELKKARQAMGLEDDD